MDYDEKIVKIYELDLFKRQIYDLCNKKQLTHNELAETLKNPQGNVEVIVRFMLKNGYLSCDKVLIGSRWVRKYKTTQKEFKVRDLDEMQQKHDSRMVRHLEKGKYDDIINANPNLTVHKLMDRVKPYRAGRRKHQKFTGIGSSFAMFNGF